MRMLDVVLPLKVNGPLGSSDLDRFNLLLLPSFDRFFSDIDALRFTLILPREDMHRVASQLRSNPAYNIVLICEDDLCPDLKEIRGNGWFKQQVLKLAAARLSGSPYYLVLDADVILKRACSLEDWFPNGKPLVQLAKAATHWDWWEASSRILKSNVKLGEYSPVMDVTPQFLHRSSCVALQQAIASRNTAPSWERLLMESIGIPWTEYTLYWLYLMEHDLVRELYDDSDRKISDGIWLHKRFNWWHLRKAFKSDAWFLVIQSNLGLDPLTVHKRISPWLR